MSAKPVKAIVIVSQGISAITGSVCVPMPRAAVTNTVIRPTRPFGNPVDVSSASGALAFSAIMQQIGRDNETALITVSLRRKPWGHEVQEGRYATNRTVSQIGG
ncbi:MAG: hypothetical protein ABSA97_14875 [Verrucomicrobiia bacterium]